jgi:threonine/homoserine/homoserine lactone efflux protein
MVAFALVSAGIMLVPGPSNFFLLTHGVAHGRRSALAATAGIEIGSAIRVVLVAAGLTAVLASSAVALNVIRWAGVGYLTFLGIRAFRREVRTEPSCAGFGSVSAARSIRSGLLVGLGNPKMVVFYLSFFPQFIHPARGSELVQIMVLGGIFWAIGAAWDVVFALAAGVIGAWLPAAPCARGDSSRRRRDIPRVGRLVGSHGRSIRGVDVRGSRRSTESATGP